MKIAELAGDEDSDYKSRTFVFSDEGHTLGNALRSIIVNYPDVQFCGYTVPHPAETKMHLRIQTTGPKAVDVLLKGLHDLAAMCDHTLNVFEVAYLPLSHQAFKCITHVKCITSLTRRIPVGVLPANDAMDRYNKEQASTCK